MWVFHLKAIVSMKALSITSANPTISHFITLKILQSQVVEGYVFLEKSSLLGGEVTAAFTAVVDDTLSSCLREVLLPLPGMEERVKACITPQELIKLLPQHYFLPCLKRVQSIFDNWEGKITREKFPLTGCCL
jgi:hypothetical protein